MEEPTFNFKEQLQKAREATIDGNAMIPIRHFAGIRFYKFSDGETDIIVGQRPRHGKRELYLIEVTRFAQEESRAVCRMGHDQLFTIEASVGGGICATSRSARSAARYARKTTRMQMRKE